MSTERQQYSIPNQMAAIALYAAEHRLTIVETYVDEAISGLRLNNRPGLIRLLNDVQSGASDFTNVLVLDVGRWGRFQDTDESAYYEFICKQAGIGDLLRRGFRERRQSAVGHLQEPSSD